MTSSLPPGDADSAGPPLRVLVVDDLVDAAVTMARLLKLLGCDVQTANDGHAALAIADQFVPEIVLLDLGLPGMDGFEVARQLRARPHGAKTWIVAISGYGHATARQEALAAGCDDHLLKPVGVDQLQAILTERQRLRSTG